MSSQYDSFRNAIEHGPGMHDAVHCAINGNMCTSGASKSPEFFLHHAYVNVSLGLLAVTALF